MKQRLHSKRFATRKRLDEGSMSCGGLLCRCKKRRRKLRHAHSSVSRNVDCGCTNFTR